MNTNEKQFEMPKAVVVVFECEDVITTSGGNGNSSGGGFEGEWDFNIPEI